jgi:uncharacterized protein (DUF2249 family)
MASDLSVAETLATEPILHESECDRTLSALTKVLTRALRQLGEAGAPEAASRLAAQAWVGVRANHRAEAERLAGLLHYLARLHSDAAVEKASIENAVTDGVENRMEDNAMSATDQLLDVRAEAPARRHDLIFETYNALSPGTAFVLVNDHDPKPLYYQFAAEHEGDFTWEYLEQGPEVWRVRIGRPEAG